MYEFKRECLTQCEQLSEQGRIDLFYGDEFYGDEFYGDESGVSLMPCVPYDFIGLCLAVC